MADIRQTIVETTEVRREFFADAWAPLADPWVPRDVREAVVDEIIEAMCRDMRHEEHTGNTDAAGSIKIGNETWTYRR